MKLNPVLKNQNLQLQQEHEDEPKEIQWEIRWHLKWVHHHWLHWELLHGLLSMISAWLMQVLDYAVWNLVAQLIGSLSLSVCIKKTYWEFIDVWSGSSQDGNQDLNQHLKMIKSSQIQVHIKCKASSNHDETELGVNSPKTESNYAETAPRS